MLLNSSLFVFRRGNYAFGFLKSSEGKYERLRGIQKVLTAKSVRRTYAFLKFPFRGTETQCEDAKKNKIKQFKKWWSKLYHFCEMDLAGDTPAPHIEKKPPPFGGGFSFRQAFGFSLMTSPVVRSTSLTVCGTRWRWLLINSPIMYALLSHSRGNQSSKRSVLA